MIRRCNLSDKEKWCELNLEFMSYEYEDENVWENPLEKGDPGKIFTQIIRDDNSPNILFFVEEEGQVVGFINTAYFTSVWAHGDVLYIDDFFILGKFRGRGYGKKALQDLENLMKADGYKSLYLLAENTNPDAVKFYESQNYSRQKINFFCKHL